MFDRAVKANIGVPTGGVMSALAAPARIVILFVGGGGGGFPTPGGGRPGDCGRQPLRWGRRVRELRRMCVRGCLCRRRVARTLANAAMRTERHVARATASTVVATTVATTARRAAISIRRATRSPARLPRTFNRSNKTRAPPARRPIPARPYGAKAPEAAGKL